MLLTIFLAIVFSAAISLMMLSAVAFIQDYRLDAHDICFDYFLLMKFKFFQYYFPEVADKPRYFLLIGLAMTNPGLV